MTALAKGLRVPFHEFVPRIHGIAASPQVISLGQYGLQAKFVADAYKTPVRCTYRFIGARALANGTEVTTVRKAAHIRRIDRDTISLVQIINTCIEVGDPRVAFRVANADFVPPRGGEFREILGVSRRGESKSSSENYLHFGTVSIPKLEPIAPIIVQRDASVKLVCPSFKEKIPL